MNRKFRFTLISYLIATVGLLLVALGVALSIVSNLGTSPLSAPAYVVSGTFGLTVGNWNIIVNMLYMVVQMIVLRREFKLKYLMQIPASIVFGYLIDFCLLCVGWIHPESFAFRVGLIILACAVTALGVSIEVVAKAWMLSAEMTVYAFTKKIHKEFGTIKVVMDSSLVVISCIVALLMYGNPFGSGQFTGIADVMTGTMDGVVIGLGTLLMALLTGWMMRLTNPIADKFIDRIIERKIYNDSES